MTRNLLGMLIAAYMSSCAGAETSPSPGAFDLVDGKSRAVCRAYKAYLERHAFAEGDVRPACDRQIPSEVASLRQPRWTRLNASEHFGLLTRIEEYFQVPFDAAATKPSRPYTERNPLSIATERLRIETASVDIDNDGTTETLLRFRDDQSCLPEAEAGYRYGGWSAPLLVATADLRSIDVPRTAALMQNQRKQYIANHAEMQAAAQARSEGKNVAVPLAEYRYSAFAAGDTHYRSYDVFEFEGKSYFDRFVRSADEEDSQHLTVFRIDRSKVSTECELIQTDRTNRASN